MKQAFCLSTYLSNVKRYTSVPVPAICLLILTQLAVQIEIGFEFCHQTPHVFCCPARYVSPHFNQVHTPTQCSAIVTAPLYFSKASYTTTSSALTIAQTTKFMLMLLVLQIYCSHCSEIVFLQHQAGNRSNPGMFSMSIN